MPLTDVPSQLQKYRSDFYTNNEDPRVIRKTMGTSKNNVEVLTLTTVRGTTAAEVSGRNRPQWP